MTEENERTYRETPASGPGNRLYKLTPRTELDPKNINYL